MDHSLGEVRRSGWDYLRLKLSAWFFTGAIAYLIFALIFETTRFPPIILLVIVALCAYLLFVYRGKIKQMENEDDFRQRDSYNRPSSFHDPRFSQETQQKVQQALNLGAFGSGNKFRPTDGGGQKFGSGQYQFASEDPQLKYEGQTPNKFSQYQGVTPNDYMKTPLGARDGRKVYLDLAPGGWSTVVKQEAGLSPFRGGATQTVTSQAPAPFEQRAEPQRVFDRDQPLTYSVSRGDLIRQSSNPLISKSKSQLNVRPIFAADGDPKDVEMREELSLLLSQFRVDLQEFTHWANHNLAIWISRTLIPDLILRNFANLKEINAKLGTMGLALPEYYCASNFAEGDWANEGFDMERRRSGLTYMDVDQFLRAYQTNFADFRKFQSGNLERMADFNQTIQSLKILGNERIKLDLYFGDANVLRNEARLSKLRRLYQLKDEGFRLVYDMVPEGVRDEELLLDLVIQCIRENDLFFRQRKAPQRTFVSPILRNVGVEPTDFFIQKDPATLVLILEKSKTRFPFTIEGVMQLGVFLVHFINDRHKTYLRGLPHSPLTELIQHMDIFARRA